MPPTQMDQDAVNLAKAIRQTESGGNFDAKGKSGEYGAYQWMPATWKAHAKEALGDENAPMTRENQNAVAYTVIKKRKDAGLNAAQIAAEWNSGSSTGWENKVGTNSAGAKYDVPRYVKSVTDAYQTIKNGGQVGVDPNNPSSVASGQGGQQSVQLPGLAGLTPITSNPLGTENKAPEPAPTEEIKPKNDLLNNPLTRGIQSFFPGAKVGQAIGTLGGYGYEKLKGLLGGQDNSKFYDLSAPTPLQTIGDVAQGALTIGAGMPAGTAGLRIFGKALPVAKTAATALGRIGQAGLLGAGLGASNALAEGKTKAGDIVKSAATGTVVGGALGSTGELLSKAANVLPERFARSYIPGINKKTAKYAVEKGLGSPEKMLTESNSVISNLGKELGSSLENPKYANVGINGQEIVDDVIKQFPDAGLTPETVWGEVKKLAKLKAGLVSKLEKGETLNLKQLHSLNSTLGPNIYKTVFDDPAVKAGKEMGSAIYHIISDKIKAVAPETVPLFDTLSKEYPLQKALEAAIRRGEKSKIFNLRDLIALVTGFGAAGPVGAVTGLVGENILTSPTVGMKVGGLLSKVNTPTASAVGNAIKAPAIRGATGLLNR